MSAIVKTVTPFIDKECLLKALDTLSVKYSVNNDQIKTAEHNFIYRNGSYILDVYSYNYQAIDWKNYKSSNKFLISLEDEYRRIYAEKLAEIERLKQEALQEQERQRLEEEARRLEEERKAFVEQQKKSIIEKAKAEGYSVKEKRVNNKIKLVLRRNTY